MFDLSLFEFQGVRDCGPNGQVLAEVAELAAQQYLMKNKCSQIIHQPSNERQAAILANTLLGTVRLFYERNQN